MSNWSPTDWGMFLTALGTFITAAFSAIAAFLANMAKIKSEANSRDIKENTDLTKRGTKDAADNAAAAAAVARVAAKNTGDLASKLNGELDEKIRRIVRDNMEENIKGVTDYVHQRNHDMLEAIQAQSLKLDHVIEIVAKMAGSAK